MSVLPCCVTSADISSPSWFTTSRGRDTVFLKVKLLFVKCIPCLYGGCSLLCGQVGGEKRPRYQDGACRTMRSCTVAWCVVLAQRCDQRKPAQAALCMGTLWYGWDHSPERDATPYEILLHVRPRRAGVCWLCDPFDLPLVVLGCFLTGSDQARVKHHQPHSSYTTPSQLLGRWACLNWTEFNFSSRAIFLRRQWFPSQPKHARLTGGRRWWLQSINTSPINPHRANARTGATNAKFCLIITSRLINPGWRF